jgi:hypothetical protein
MPPRGKACVAICPMCHGPPVDRDSGINAAMCRKCLMCHAPTIGRYGSSAPRRLAGNTGRCRRRACRDHRSGRRGRSAAANARQSHASRRAIAGLAGRRDAAPAGMAGPGSAAISRLLVLMLPRAAVVARDTLGAGVALCDVSSGGASVRCGGGCARYVSGSRNHIFLPDSCHAPPTGCFSRKRRKAAVWEHAERWHGAAVWMSALHCEKLDFRPPPSTRHRAADAP